MSDPMADLGNTVSTHDMDDSKEVFDPMILQCNLARIERIQSVMGIASGCIAGISGFTGLEGLGCFLALHVFISLAIWAWKMDFDLQSYTKQSWFKYLTGPMQQTGLSFTLFWTLFYGLVFLY